MPGYGYLLLIPQSIRPLITKTDTGLDQHQQEYHQGKERTSHENKKPQHSPGSLTAMLEVFVPVVEVVLVTVARAVQGIERAVDNTLQQQPVPHETELHTLREISHAR